MPDVFISYSRRDLAFVRRLHDALVARGKDVWVDWEDIPLTAEWREEVFEGVESSDNFLFVISPDSLESETCAAELGHALEQRKRLVPVLRRNADGRAVPDALSARNWTFFRDDDDFGPSFEALVSALDTDLEWVSAHTRLLGRAIEWDKLGRDGSYLLRGRDLADAERWVASQSAEREPQPTALQMEYALASRQATTRRQRVLVGAALVAVAVASGLALLALQQRNEARREAQIAFSRQLAAQAVAALDVDPERSLALAAHAATVRETDEARDALRRALRSPLAHAIVSVSTRRLWDAQFSQDGTQVVTAGEDGIARIWNAEDPRATRLRASLRAGVSLSSARFSPDGRYVVTADERGARVWLAAAGAGAPTASFGKDVHTAAFSPDGKLVASGGDNGLQLWSLASRRPVGRLSRRAGRGRFTDLAFSRDGRRIVAAAGSTVAIWSVREGRRLALLEHPRDVRVWDVAFRLDGSQVATAGADGVARVWNASTGRIAYQLAGHTDTLQSVEFSSDGRFLLTGSDDATARLWDLETRRTVAELLGHAGPVLAASFRPDDGLIATSGADGALRLWPPPNQPLLELPMPNRRRVRDIGFSPDGRHLVTASEDGTARIWSGVRPSSPRVLRHGRRGEPDDWVESATFDRDGIRVLTAGDDGTAKVWDRRTGSLLGTLGEQGGPALRDADFSPDGSVVAVADENDTMRLWRWEQEGPPELIGRHPERVDGVAFAANGRTVAGASWDGKLRLWSIEGARTPIATLTGDGDRLSSVEFDPAGARVAAGGWSGSAWVWDVPSRRRVATLPGRALIAAVSFSHDGRFLATAGDDGVARVYAAESGRPVARIPTRARSLEAATFSPVSWSIGVAGEGGEAAVLDCLECRPFDELVCLAADRLGPRARERLPEAAREAIDSRRARCHPR